MDAISSRRLPCARSRAAAIRPTSSFWSTPLVRVRSPSAMAAASEVTAVSGRMMRRTTANAIPSTASVPSTMTAMIRRVVLVSCAFAAAVACAARFSIEDRSVVVSLMIS